MKSNYKQLGQFIRQVDVRNSEGKEENLLGVSVQKKFIPSIANTVGTDFKKYKVVKKGQFTYIPDTSRRGDKIGIALLEDDEEGLVSNVYTVFEIIDEKQLIPEYLMLWFSRPGVVNLELEVLKMKIIIIFIDLLMATVLFFVGRFFIKSRNTERSVLFLSGDYTGLNTEKICRVTGKRINTWAMLFCLGGIIDFIKLGAGIIIVSVFFIILLVFHLVDMTINRDKYRV